jgi:glycosyltransferase involved in cell wall biosynthesis
MKILIITLKDPNIDPRPNKQIRHLSENHHVTVIGKNKIHLNGVETYENRYHISFVNVMVFFIMNIFGFFDKSYEIFSKPGSLKKFHGLLLEKDFDCIIAHDIETLPFAFQIKKRAKIIFDAHEYFPDQFGSIILNVIFNRYHNYFGEKYLKLCDLVFTVSEGIAEKYSKNFGIKPIVIMNTPPYVDLSLHQVKPDKIRIIHHGAAAPARKLEKMIEMMKFIDPHYELFLMLIPSDQRYFNRLKKMAKYIPNIHFLDPVPMPHIVNKLNEFDVGLFIYDPISVNALFVLPNKFFEFIQARLAIAIGPSPEMAAIVKKYDLGIVAEDFNPETMARMLNNLSKGKIQYFMAQSDAAASELCAEKSYNILDYHINKILLNE